VFGRWCCRIDPREVELLPRRGEVIPLKPYNLQPGLKKEDTIVSVGKVRMAEGGSCHRRSVRRGEPRPDHAIASMVRDAGAVMLRGGAFKRGPARTRSGLGEEGLKY
jgi:3-deoxy-D-arabino-heptulosonate 7-phosphate (DAHP) synthase